MKKEYLVKYKHLRVNQLGQKIVMAMNLADARKVFLLYVTENNRDPLKQKLIIKIESITKITKSCSK